MEIRFVIVYEAYVALEVSNTQNLSNEKIINKYCYSDKFWNAG